MNLLQLKINDPQTKKILYEGKVGKGGDAQYAMIYSILELKEPEIVFELKSKNEILKPSLFKRYWVAIRAISLTASFTPGIAVILYGSLIRQWHLNRLASACAIVSVILFQIAINVFNDVEDHLKLIDLPGVIGGSGVIQKAWISAQQLRNFASGSLCLGVLIGVYPVLQAPQILITLGVLSLLGVLGYSGWPLRLKYRALGDLTVLLMCGPMLSLGFSFAVFQSWDNGIISLGLMFGAAAVGILHANNLNDIEVDKKRGAKTLASQVGFKFSQIYFVWIYLFLLVSLLVSVALHWIPVAMALMPFLLLIPILNLNKKVLNASGPLSPAIAGIRFEAAQLHLLLGVALCLGVFCSRFFF